MSYTICPHITTAYANLSIRDSTKTIDCSAKPYKFFDQIVLEQYDKGCRMFFCEIGRGDDTFSKTHYKGFIDMQVTIQSYCKKQLLSSEPDDMNGKFCIIDFGSKSKTPPEINNNECIYTNFKFDDYFVDEFKKWFIEFTAIHDDIYIEFIDMTVGNISSSKELMQSFIKEFNALRKNSIIKFGTYTYTDAEKKSSYDFEIPLRAVNKFFNNFLKSPECPPEDVLEGGNYKNKYLKYKSKYLELKKLLK